MNGMKPNGKAMCDGVASTSLMSFRAFLIHNGLSRKTHGEITGKSAFICFVH